MWLGSFSLEKQHANKPQFYCENSQTAFNTDNALLNDYFLGHAGTLNQDVVFREIISL